MSVQLYTNRLYFNKIGSILCQMSVSFINRMQFITNHSTIPYFFPIKK